MHMLELQHILSTYGIALLTINPLSTIMSSQKTYHCLRHSFNFLHQIVISHTLHLNVTLLYLVPT